MPNKKQRLQNADNYRRHLLKLPPRGRCPNCKRPAHGGHFVPPSLGSEGFYVCESAPE